MGDQPTQTLPRASEATVGSGGSNGAVRVRRPDAGELPELAALLAAAFYEDPVFAWCFPDRGARQRVLPAVFGTFVDAYHGLGETYTVGDQAAGAVCAPPAGEPDEQRLAALAEVAGDYAERTFAVSESMNAEHPHEPHYYVLFIATRPALQSRGLGSAVLTRLLERCDRDGVPAYLDATSERNRRLYRRHGFEVRYEARIPGGPAFWPMWREPR